VQPKASRNAIKVEKNRPLRVYVTAPPSDGAANKAVIEVLAKKLGIAKRKVSIVSGQTSRKKSVVVEDMEPAFAASILLDKNNDE